VAGRTSITIPLTLAPAPGHRQPTSDNRLVSA
jgi:hypothetical protein